MSHELTFERILHLVRFVCACGWKGKPAWTLDYAEGEADRHLDQTAATSGRVTRDDGRRR